MTKEEVLMQLEDMEYSFENFEMIECTPDDAEAVRIAKGYINLGLQAFTTEELLQELSRRIGLLEDGAVG